MSDKKPTAKKESPAPSKRSPQKHAKADVSMPKANSEDHSLNSALETSEQSVPVSYSSQVEMAENPVPEIIPMKSVAPVSAATEQKSRTETTQAASESPSRKVLDVFLIDSGWNNEVATAVRENLPVFNGYLKGQRFFVLSEEQSLAFIKKHPALVGADPILIVLDREAAKQNNPKGYGFRLCLGHMRNPEAALSMMKWAIQLSMASSGPEMSSIVRESGHRQSIQGTIELIGEGTGHLLEFAPV